MQQAGSRRLLPIAIILLFLAAAAAVVLIVIFRSAISVSSLTQGVPRQEVLSEEAPVETPETTQTEEVSSFPEDCIQATLTVIEEGVVLRRVDEDDFSPVTRSVWVGCGDVVRTNASGSAQIVFFDNTETTVFPNSEVMLTNFTRDSGGSFLIRMEQTIGRLFHRVNFTDPNSIHEVTTPHGVAAVRGTAYCSVAHVEGDLDSFHCMVGRLSVTAFLSSQTEMITCPTVTIDLGPEGALSTRDLYLYCGEGISMRDLNPYCGDGICDAYMDEDAISCAEDCG